MSVKLSTLSTEDEVCAWLGSLPAELASYFGSVRANKVDGRVLFQKPVAEVLDLMGVTSVGHKVVLKKNIEALRNDSHHVLLEDAGPVSDRQVLMSPPETANWMTLKEGYLYKTKRVTKGFHKSTKLRWFVLKQEPTMLSLRLEYYEGMAFRGGHALEKVAVKPGSEGSFTLTNNGRKMFELSADKGNLKAATSWVVALQRAIGRQAAGPKAAPTKPKEAAEPAVTPAPAAEAAEPSETPDVNDPGAPARRRGGQDEEIDGNAIDQARWAAIRRANQVEEEAVAEEDEDVRLLREMEEEEERRQEEERLAFLAERAAMGQSAAPSEAGTAETAEISEDEDDVDYAEEMRKAEEEEERRQEEERQAWLAEQAAKSS